MYNLLEAVGRTQSFVAYLVYTMSFKKKKVEKISNSHLSCLTCDSNPK